MRTTIILGLLLQMFSCTTLKKVEKVNNYIPLNKDNISKIDGSYDIIANDTATVSLDLALTFKKYWWRDFSRKHEYYLQIKTIDNCHLMTSIFRADTLIAQKKIKFKIRDGQLLISKTRISPFYLIINGFDDMKTRITLTQSDNLLIDHDNFQMMTLVVIPLTGDRAKCGGLEFRRRSASR